MAPLSTLFEHEAIPFDWSPGQFAALERLNRSVGVDVLRPTIRDGQNALQASQHVGVVRLGQTTFQILPKIYRTAEKLGDKALAQAATRNLMYMLLYAGQVHVREQDLAPLLRRNLDWFEILTRLFATHLAEEWQRGPYRTYHTVDDDLRVLKGKWRLTDQLRHPERQHILAVTYDEFSADNPLSRIFRYVVEQLRFLTRDPENRQLLDELRLWMEDVALLPIVTPAQVAAIPITRLNQRYETLLGLARMFIEHSTLQVAHGDLNTYALLFDMNMLFQDFIVEFIRRHRADILPAEWQNCDLLPQTRGAKKFLAYLCNQKPEPVFGLEPDLAIRQAGDTFPILLDTKYKLLADKKRNLGVGQSDFYQMYAYSQRYGCPRVLLVYPQLAGMSEPLNATFHLEDPSNPRTIQAATVNLQLDLRLLSERQRLATELKNLLAGGNQ